MSSSSMIVKSSVWSFAGQLATKFFSFIYTILIARMLLPEELGAFYLALSIISVLFIFTDLGIDYSLARYVPYLYGKKKFGKLKDLIKLGYFGGAFSTIIFASLVFLLAQGISTFVNAPQIAPAIRILSAYLFFDELFIVAKGILRGRKKIRDISFLDALQSIAKLLLTIPLILLMGGTAQVLALGFLFSFMFIVPFGIYLAHREVRAIPAESYSPSVKERVGFIKEIISFGMVTSVIVALWFAVQYMDRIMMSYFNVPLSDIGIYSIAIGLANLIIIFPSSINSIFFPLISELFGMGKKEEMEKIIQTSIKWTVSFMLPIILVLIAFSDGLLRMFYGSAYGAGWVVLVLFSIGIFIKSTFSICSSTIAAMRRLDIEIIIAIASCATNAVLNLFLIPAWGMNGAAFASLLSFLVYSILVTYYFRKKFSFSFSKDMHKPILAGLLAIGLIFIMKSQLVSIVNNNFLGLAAGLSQDQALNEIAQQLIKLAAFGILFIFSAVLYLSILILLKFFGEEEKKVFAAGLRKMKVPEKYILDVQNML